MLPPLRLYLPIIVVGEDSILPHNLLKYLDKIIGRLIASPTYFGGSKPPPYSYFFCNRKRTAIYFGGAFVVIFSPLRTTEIISEVFLFNIIFITMTLTSL